jgi:hypothetical protein
MPLLLAAALALPAHGALVPGRSLGGLRLGMTQAQVARAWGRGHGICDGCARPTWYYTYKPFTQQGAAVAFSRGRVAAIYTLWQPLGWHTHDGLLLGDPSVQVTTRYGGLASVNCGGYLAYTLTRRRTTTEFYILNDKLWGFGLSRPPAPACP